MGGILTKTGKTWVTNLRSSWDTIIHGGPQLSSCFPTTLSSTASTLETTCKLNPNKNAVRKTWCSWFSNEKNGRVRRRSWALSQRASPATTPQLTACALVRKREVPLWRFLRQDYGARTKPTLEALFWNANHHVSITYDFHHISHICSSSVFRTAPHVAPSERQSGGSTLLFREISIFLFFILIVNLIPHDLV